MKNKKQLLAGILIILAIVSCKGKKEEATSADTATSTKSVSEKKGKLTKEQENQLVFGAVLATRNQMPFDKLEPEAYKDASIDVLNSAWEVSDTQSAKETLDNLLTAGHREEIDPLLEKLRTAEGKTEYSEKFEAYEDVKNNLVDDYGYTAEQIDGIKTISAWDYDRLVNVARFSYYAGYITEAEMWDYINKAVTQAKNDYNNWEEYFAGVMLGRSVAYGSSFSDSSSVADKLLKDSKSVYKSHPFK